MVKKGSWTNYLKETRRPFFLLSQTHKRIQVVSLLFCDSLHSLYLSLPTTTTTSINVGEIATIWTPLIQIDLSPPPPLKKRTTIDGHTHSRQQPQSHYQRHKLSVSPSSFNCQQYPFTMTFLFSQHTVDSQPPFPCHFFSRQQWQHSPHH